MMRQRHRPGLRTSQGVRSREAGARGACVVVLSLALTGCPFSDDDFSKVDAAGGSGSDAGIELVTVGSNSTTGALGGMGGSGTTGTLALGGSGSGPTSSTSNSGGTGAADATDSESAGGSGGSTDAGSGGSGGSGGSLATGGSGGGGGSAASGGSGGAGGLGGDDCVPLEETCDGLDNDCDDEIDNDACPEGCVGFVAAETSYLYCAELVTGGQAPTRCSNQGFAPLRIDSEQENTALLVTVLELDDTLGEDGPSQRGFWLGASDADDEGTWLWLEGGDVFWIGEGDGAAVDEAYTNWAEDRPNDVSLMGEDCAVAYLEDGNDGDAGQWNDVLCGDEYPLVCQGLPVP